MMSLTQRMGIYFGGNYTPFKGAKWNCAEKRALEIVRQRGFNRVLAIAVSGPPYHDEVSGIQAQTCQPCSKCRGMLKKSDMVTPRLLVVSANLTEDVFELHTLEALLKFHETGQPQPFPADYHPLLASYWNQILTYDAEDERSERAILAKMAEL